jgi:hypothetical protein
MRARLKFEGVSRAFARAAAWLFTGLGLLVLSCLTSCVSDEDVKEEFIKHIRWVKVSLLELLLAEIVSATKDGTGPVSE